MVRRQLVEEWLPYGGRVAGMIHQQNWGGPPVGAGLEGWQLIRTVSPYQGGCK